jgi:hypothetical protein
MKGVTIQTERLIEMVADKVVSKAVEKLKEAIPCTVHSEKIASMEQSLKGDNGNGLISKVENLIPKVSGLWWKITIAVAIGVGLNKGLTLIGIF